MTTEFNELPTVESCKLVSFEHATVLPGFVNDTYFLVVSGTKPYMNMEVKLIPRVYVVQPDYWGIEVVGCIQGIGLPAEDTYTLTISLDGIRGKKGVEVFGSNNSQKFEIGK